MGLCSPNIEGAGMLPRCRRCLGPSCMRNAAKDIALFDEKQKNTQMALEQILQTDEGKVIAPSHNADHNVQSICKEFLQVMPQSTEAMMDSRELLSHLPAAKICVGSWRGATNTLMLNWIDKPCLFHELTPGADRLSECTQLTLLQNALIGLNALELVLINSDLQQAAHGTFLRSLVAAHHC
jgi:hypothetical protein